VTAQLQLVVVAESSRVHDLPPAWDGQAVEWTEWEQRWTTMRLHTKPDVCDFCGSTAEPGISLGLVQPKPGEQTTITRTVKAKRSGREYGREVDVDAWAIYWLAAFRCPGCSHDVVWDRRTDEWWDLDEQDYTDEGSTEGTLF
jgi:predicted RNA-binding Zn-ribbon protein involved in translation (DUF1610 family)